MQNVLTESCWSIIEISFALHIHSYSISTETSFIPVLRVTNFLLERFESDKLNLGAHNYKIINQKIGYTC